MIDTYEWTFDRLAADHATLARKPQQSLALTTYGVTVAEGQDLAPQRTPRLHTTRTSIAGRGQLTFAP